MTKNLSNIDSFFSNNALSLLFSQELLDEFTEVVQRPKLKKYFSIIDLQDLLTKINTKAEFITIASFVKLCRDPKDNFLLSLAMDGKVTHLITGDKDLLVLETFAKTQILTITDYLIRQ